jgi:hypothetical protein
MEEYPMCVKCGDYPQAGVESGIAHLYAHLCLDCFQQEQVGALIGEGFLEEDDDI